MTSPQPSAPWWADMPEIDEPVADVAADQRARTDQALARLRAHTEAEAIGDHLYPPVEIDREALEAWYQGQEDIPY